MPGKPRVLGTCYVCGRKVWGYSSFSKSDSMRAETSRGGVIRDANGLRHGGRKPCIPSAPGLGAVLET